MSATVVLEGLDSNSLGSLDLLDVGRLGNRSVEDLRGSKGFHIAEAGAAIDGSLQGLKALTSLSSSILYRAQDDLNVPVQCLQIDPELTEDDLGLGDFRPVLFNPPFSNSPLFAKEIPDTHDDYRRLRQRYDLARTSDTTCIDERSEASNPENSVLVKLKKKEKNDAFTFSCVDQNRSMFRDLNFY